MSYILYKRGHRGETWCQLNLCSSTTELYIMGFQWMVCWWWLLCFTIWGTLNLKPAFFLAREVGPWIHCPRQSPKLAYQGIKKKPHEFAHGKKVLCFPFKNIVEQDLCWPLCQVCGEVFFHNLGEWYCGGERKREREDHIIPIMHVGCNSNYFPNFACGLDH